MKELIVVKHDTYGSGLTLATATLDNLSSLATGAFAIFDTDPSSANYGKVVDIAKATPDAVPAIFTIAWGPGTDTVTGTALTPRQSQTIVKANSKMIQTTYVAPVAKAIQIGKTSSDDTTKSYKLPTMANLSPSVQTAGFKVVDTSKPEYDTSRYYTYAVPVGTADTEETITTALVALVSADTKAIVTAAVGYSGSTTSIVLTSKTAGKNFEVGKEGVLKLADLTILTAQNPGQGVSKDLKQIENETIAEDGQYDSLGIAKGINLFTASKQVDLTKNYNLNFIRFFAPSERAPIMDNGEKIQETIVLATDTTLTAAATGNSMNGLATLYTALK